VRLKRGFSTSSEVYLFGYIAHHRHLPVVSVQDLHYAGERQYAEKYRAHKEYKPAQKRYYTYETYDEFAYKEYEALLGVEERELVIFFKY
jgi:hypothetical protein